MIVDTSTLRNKGQHIKHVKQVWTDEHHFQRRMMEGKSHEERNRIIKELAAIAKEYEESSAWRL